MQTLTPVNQVFLDNMAQLWRYNAKLAQRIDDLPIDATLDVQPSKKGPPTAVVQRADGHTVFLHSRYDPQREALDFSKSLEKSDAYCVILAGLGLGYHIKAIVETLGDETVIFVSEPDLVTVKTALEHTDLSNELSKGRVEILTDLEKGALHERLSLHSTMLMLGTVFAAPPVSRDHNAEFHTTCREAIMDFAAFAKMSLVTLLQNAVITCRNIAYNLPTYVSTPPPDLIRNQFIGCPAILVAAGPSLAKNIGQLRALQDKAVIIAAQTTLRLLLDEGVRPHFVTSLDFSEMSRQFFEGLTIPEDLVLVAEPKASWHVIDTYRASMGKAGNRVILLANEFAHRCIGEDLARRSPMEAGATVMHLAFYLAQWLGCDPIIFVGQDLAFSGHCYYAPGVAMHHAWGPELGRYSTLEMKEWDRIVRQREILRKVKDISGRDIYTDDQMFTYLEQFERDFARADERIIDATEGGARKSFAEVMSLEQAAGQYCREPIAADRFDFLRTDWHGAASLDPAREAVAARRGQLEAFRKVCLETQEVLAELAGLVDRPDRFNRRMVRVDELRTLVQGHGVVFRMVQDVSQLGELQKVAADRRRPGDPAGGSALARRQLQRDRRFIDSLLEGCDTLQRILDQTLNRFDEAVEAAR